MECTELEDHESRRYSDISGWTEEEKKEGSGGDKRGEGGQRWRQKL